MVEHWYTIVTIPSTLDDFQQALTAPVAQLELAGNHLMYT